MFQQEILIRAFNYARSCHFSITIILCVLLFELCVVLIRILYFFSNKILEKAKSLGFAIIFSLSFIIKKFLDMVRNALNVITQMKNSLEKVLRIGKSFYFFCKHINDSEKEIFERSKTVKIEELHNSQIPYDWKYLSVRFEIEEMIRNPDLKFDKEIITERAVTEKGTEFIIDNKNYPWSVKALSENVPFLQLADFEDIIELDWGTIISRSRSENIIVSASVREGRKAYFENEKTRTPEKERNPKSEISELLNKERSQERGKYSLVDTPKLYERFRAFINQESSGSSRSTDKVYANTLTEKPKFPSTTLKKTQISFGKWSPEDKTRKLSSPPKFRFYSPKKENLFKEFSPKKKTIAYDDEGNEFYYDSDEYS